MIQSAPTPGSVAPVELLLLRHGIAEEARAGLLDRERALTERGRHRTRAVLERLVALGMTADRVLSSPLLRARQTAEITVASLEALGLRPGDTVHASVKATDIECYGA